MEIGRLYNHGPGALVRVDLYLISNVDAWRPPAQEMVLMVMHRPLVSTKSGSRHSLNTAAPAP